MGVRLKPVSVVGWGLGLLALAAAWAALAPTSLLGATSYLSTYGTSMLPYLHAGDLVAVRPADIYEVGDVVAYHNAILKDQIILHRVVGFDGTRLVMQGDNNPNVDEYHPWPADVVGKEWFHVSGIGEQIGKLRTSGNAAVVFGVAGLFAAGIPVSISNWLTGRHNRRKPTRGKRRQQAAPDLASPQLITTAGVLAATAAVGLIASLVVFAFAQQQPMSKARGVDAQYAETGNYSWSGSAPKGSVYPDGTLTTGDPLFLQLTRTMHVGFVYALTSTEPVAVGGSASLSAVLQSNLTGWTRTIVLQPETPFVGSIARLGADLDVGAMFDLGQAYVHEVGLRSDDFKLTVVADIKTHGNVGGVPIAHEIAPKLPFHLDATVLRLATEGLPDLGATGQWTAGNVLALSSGGPSTTEERRQMLLNPLVDRSVVKRAVTSNRITALGLTQTVADTRQFSFDGTVLFAAGGLLCLCLLVVGLRSRDEPSRIQRRYGSQLVPVGRIAAIRQDAAVQVTSMASLVRLAEHHDRMILHEEEAGEHWYAIQDDNLFYFYRTRNWPQPPSFPPDRTWPEKAAVAHE